MEVYDAALAEPWAIRPEALELILAIASRTNEVTPQALEAYRAQNAEKGERLRTRDDVAIIDIAGPLFKRANIFQAISGASSYAIMARDLQTALDDPAVRGIILNIDSPGGTVNGTDELATAVYNARGQKQIIAYVSGQAASAAYWIASAADKIVLSDASIVGSIGIVAAIEDRKVADERRGVRTVEFVSSKAPGKRPDYDTDEGRAQIQRHVDDLEKVFIATVARNRGVDEDTVASDFGAGGVEVGANAVAKGMADAIGTFETVFAELTRGNSRRVPQWSARSFPMTDKTGATAENPAVATQADLDRAVADATAKGVKQGAEAERARIAAILDSDDGKANAGLAAHFAFKTGMSADDAVAALKAAAPAAKAGDDEKDDAAAYAARKAKTGALGFAEPAGGNRDDGKSVMASVVEKINARNKGRLSA